MFWFRMTMFKKRSLYSILFICLIFLISRQHRSYAVVESVVKSNAYDAFYSEVYELLISSKPMDPPSDKNSFRLTSCDLPKDVGINDLDRFEKLSFDNLQRCYHLSNEQAQDLQKAHSSYVKSIKDLIDNHSNIISKDDEKKKGILTVGGGRYSVLLFTMIQKLRETGTTLPVEVLIPPQDEGDDEFCNVILPQFNAKCIYFKDYLPPNLLDKLVLKSYQIKALGLLMTSFNQILFLDADNYPMKNLNYIFETESFQKYGLITWPDIWRRYTPPAYYNIADIDFNLEKRVRFETDDISPVSRYDDIFPTLLNDERKLTEYTSSKVPFHDLEGTISDLTTESGQMLIDKKKHLDTLLLAFYYNFYGPSWYYNMFSLGSSGEGDKETFISAAHALGKPYYQVKSKVEFDGFFHDKDGFQGLGLMQHDFEQDYQVHKNAMLEVAGNPDKYSKYESDYKLETSFTDQFLRKYNNKKDLVDIMFVHASFFKFEPLELHSKNRYYMSDNSPLRGFKRMDRMNNFDLELFNFQILRDNLCSTKPVAFKVYEDKYDTDEWKSVCEYLDKRVTFLKKTHEEAINAAKSS
ncbi:hypothetical protein KAFR_0G00280 [Kazachstania africana CBS 2517]|uniref:Uncharacterized protein n=1 Tax=Kazachstania africana (strain ATCC 22294 / BCRC 22015 / CBS 2517 / CECT 1963 / NBRC 1671 / NRRL Y-8276) TaxID=1071382 RepID=H2AXG1_KAZAF|nr:hypothetical protein KAFR_0G00280 [Kazachstania africana CBS 2517]CCF59061.1 hypothetical protein KAFR_0G00280 [Kazachstania africana CBS 2517]